MFASRLVAKNSRICQRFASTSTKGTVKSNKEVFLSDSGAYPVMFIMTFSGCLAAMWSFNTIRKNPDIRLGKGTRQNGMRGGSWPTEQMVPTH